VRDDIAFGLENHQVESKDMDEIIERFAAEVRERRFGLLEALAEHLAGIVIGEMKAPWVRLSIAKVGHVRNARRVGVVIERGARPA
jgi:dihydroneopterin aldolase